jgi:Ca2+-binding RTX toxin-like protein
MSRHRLAGRVAACAILLASFLAVPTSALPTATAPVVIGEFRTRGPAGAADEFVELYNRSGAAVQLGGWKLRGSSSSGFVTTRLTIAVGTTLGPGCRFLAAGSGFVSGVAADQAYAIGIADDGGVALARPDDTVVDQIGMSAGSAFREGGPLAPLTAGTDQSYARRAGGGQDTDDNGADFALAEPSGPESMGSACASLPSISIGDATVGEGAGSAPLTVVLSEASAATVTASFSTADGTAVAGTDYTAASGTVTFAPGDTEETVAIPVVADGVDEPDEGLTVLVTEPVNATIGDGQGGATILDDDGPCTIMGTSGDDVLSGTAARDYVCGLGGDDTILGGDGNDVLLGGPGADRLLGEGGNDALLPGSGDDPAVDGGPGADAVSYGDAAAGGVTVDLSATPQGASGAGVDTLFGIENVTGSPFADVIVGSSGPNTLAGGGGDDAISAGDGNDVIVPGAGDDAVDGGAGSDGVNYGSARTGVVVDLSAAPGTSAGEGSDSLGSVENVTGSPFPDRLTGSGGKNILSGVGGDDTLEGGAGTDYLYGGAGADALGGGSGQDVLDGGPDADDCSDPDAGTTYRGCP